ncbi:hypothetical protein [Candidatus Lokiarchaeum ossiferum]|uniref:hypothetical protein n=1 Tax=Candidatus Lokiarchaeum ossiferum TaxID=2951803 RepID=UPI00352D3BAB
MNTNKADLFTKLIQWSDQIPFTITNGSILVTNIEDFIKKLDIQFEEWGQENSLKSKI